MHDRSVLDGNDAATRESSVSRFFPYRVLALLFITYSLSYLDRQVISILLIPIRTEFTFSDTLAGLLVGPAFGVFYTLSGIPLSSIADRGNRRNLITICMTVWSLMTVLCGTVQSAWQLVVLRFCIGAAEGGTQPAAVSIVTDVFPPERRSTAQAIYQIGGVLGISVGLPIAGWFAAHFGWRAAFVFVGFPGLLLVVVLLLFVQEPRRQQQGAVPRDCPSLAQTFATLWARKEMRFFYLAIAANAGMASLFQWLPTYYNRTFGLSLIEVGKMMVWTIGVGGGLGMIVGGLIVDRWARGRVIWALKYMAALPIIAGPIGLAGLFAGNATLSIFLIALWSFVTAGWAGNAYAMTQSLVDSNMRARSLAIFGLFANLVGSGSSPALAGAISQFLQPSVGQDSLRWALSVVVCLGYLAATFYLFAIFHLKHIEQQSKQADSY